MQSMIIKQLEKALACKDDTELRLRVEVLLDMIKTGYEPSQSPITIPPTPIPTYYELNEPTKVTVNAHKKTAEPKKMLSKNGEQINYIRPEGT